MERSPHTHISVSLALEGLSEASERVEALERALSDARRVRDDLVADAVYADVSVARIARLTRLSRQYIYRISPGRIREDD